MNIAITGYYGTGSSAVIDLLSEYDGCSEGGLHAYEHLPLYYPDGLFDLEHKLLLGNDPHRSDEAIKSFRKAMRILNDNKFEWCGTYQRKYGDEFMKLVEDFLGKITQFTCEGEWYNYYLPAEFNLKKFIKDLIKTFIPGKSVVGEFGKLPPRLVSDKMELSFVDEEEIVKNGYDLTINKYKEVEYEKIEYPPTSEIIAEIKKLDKEASDSLAELEKLLNETNSDL